MARPWQYEERTQPTTFDRPQNNASSGTQQPSFKTNVNRNKTRKWTEAKTYNYDGDDWGEADLYDEYGYDQAAQEQQQQPRQQPQQQHQQHQQHQHQHQYHHQHQPHHQQQQQPQYPPSRQFPRQNSFDNGGENAFSSARRPPGSGGSPRPGPPFGPGPAGLEAAAAQGYPRREFSQPSHIPPPLHPSAAPPPRKSSLSNSNSPSTPKAPPFPGSSPAESPFSANESAQDATPVKFIRPADIYKRMEQERERAKEEQSAGQRKQSLGQISEHGQPDVDGADPQSPEAPLERAETPKLAVHTASPRTDDFERSPTPDFSPPHRLPEVKRMSSAFGSDFFGVSDLDEGSHSTPPPTFDAAMVRSGGSAPPSSLAPQSSVSTHVEPRGVVESRQSPDHAQAEPSAPVTQYDGDSSRLRHQESQGLRSIVHQAFDRRDDASVPPTPISRDSSMRESETSISPIMSQPPRDFDPRHPTLDTKVSVPPTVDENEDQVRAQSNDQDQDKDLPAPYIPGYRMSMEVPSPDNSPARSPVIETPRRVSIPSAAALGNGQDVAIQSTRRASSASDDSMIEETPALQQDEPGTPKQDFTSREADLAEAASPEQAQEPSQLAQATQSAQTIFLNSHPPLANIPSLRSTSPQPPSAPSSPGTGRVRNLAGRYDELHSVSRTNSNLSFDSKTGRPTSEIAAPPSPTKLSSTEEGRPTTAREASFRPHLPGEWVSYAETPQHEGEELGSRMDDAVDADDMTSVSAKTTGSIEEPEPNTIGDPEPNTGKQTLPHKDLSVSSNPVEAVKAAGDALGAALLATVGLGGDATPSEPEPESEPEHKTERSVPDVGDIYARPLMYDRTASSVASTPAADAAPAGLLINKRRSDYFDQPDQTTSRMAPPPPLFRQPTIDSPSDLESDRLRREIERSLDPIGSPDEAPTSAAVKLHDEPASPAGPGLLAKKFSWEEQSTAVPNAEEESKRQVDQVEEKQVVEPEGGKKDRLPLPGLHVVNTNGSGRTSSADNSPVSAVWGDNTARFSGGMSELSPVSPVSPMKANHTLEDVLKLQPVHESRQGVAEDVLDRVSGADPEPAVAAIEQSREVAPEQTSLAKSVSHDSSAHEPAYDTSTSAALGPTRTNGGTADKPLPVPVQNQRIPPFREIMALSSAQDRIAAYKSTRQTYVDTDTGLQQWLRTVTTGNPELLRSASETRTQLPARHKQSSSVGKVYQGGDGGGGNGAGEPERRPSVGGAGQGMEKMQAKGKDLLHSAGVFGGKATVGAKGLFARAKGKLRESSGGGGE